MPSETSSKSAHLIDAFTGNERKATVAVSALNQLAHDYSGNSARIIQGIGEAKMSDARLWVGPELATTGYSCDEGFNESDTIVMSWGVVKNILASGVTDGVLSVVGAPVMHNGARYNVNLWIVNGKILGIRPKKSLADDGQYREGRFFTAWAKSQTTEEFRLPDSIAKLTGAPTVPIGDFQVVTDDGTVLDAEMCEEMFTANRPSNTSSLAGSEFSVNTSASHWQVGKLQGRIRRMTAGTLNAGGNYLYSNYIGADGSTLLFDGAPTIVENGRVLALGRQFSMKEVETVTATVDLSSTAQARGVVKSFGAQASRVSVPPRINAPIRLTQPSLSLQPTRPMTPEFLAPEDEVLEGGALWMWDYLRRSGANGFFLPLSGGTDSGCVAVIVANMCRRVLREIQEGNTAVLADVQKITRDNAYVPTSPEQLAERIFFTAYERNSGTSTSATEQRAAALAKEIGCTHIDAPITGMFQALRHDLQGVLGRDLLFKSEGGSHGDDLALQNGQARLRMVQSYALAQLLYRSRYGKDGMLLVLAAGNADEQRVGYATKYDAGSGDLNPIGSVRKDLVKSTLRHAGHKFGFATPEAIYGADPTADLTPSAPGAPEQKDEVDIGLTYEELNVLGVLHLEEHLGPISLFQKLVREWGPKTVRNLSVVEVAGKVKTYFRKFRANRHKAWVMTPSPHACAGNPDVHRNDLRPLFAPANCADEFAVIDAMIPQFEAEFAGR